MDPAKRRGRAPDAFSKCKSQCGRSRELGTGCAVCRWRERVLHGWAPWWRVYLL